ncbi:MAG: DUF1499 domain-containing protein [Prochlorothrix sp.]
MLPRLVSGVLVMLLGSGFFGTPAALAAPLSPTFPTSPTEASPALAPVGSSKLLSPPAVLPFLKGVFTGTAPDLGVTEGQLQPCPASPNCVVSQVVDPADSEHAIEPLSYSSDRETAHQVLLQVLSVVPGAAVVTDQPDYIRAEFTSKLMGFVDDGEFYFPDAAALIQVRSASRIGESDLGVNRRRIEQIRLALADLGL